MELNDKQQAQLEKLKELLDSGILNKAAYDAGVKNVFTEIKSSNVGAAGNAIVQGDMHIGDRNFFNAPPLRENFNLDEEIRSYCEKAEFLHENIQLAGFKTRLRVPIRIEDIYVPLRAMIDTRCTGHMCFGDSEAANEYLRECGEGREISLLEAFRASERMGRKGIVILGDPGSGKTTHLKRLLLWCLRGGLSELGLPEDMIPVFLPLRELTDLSGRLGDFIQSQLNKGQLETPEGFGKRMLKRGNLLLMFDGLDEVSEPEHREQVSRWIEDALSYPKCRFVVTCRFAGYTDKVQLNAHFLEMHVRPLDKREAEQFVHNWYKIVETAHLLDPAQAKIIAEKEADKLIQRLKRPEFRSRKVFTLTRNPLLLTNLCLVHRDRGNLPKNRARLYEECIDVLLELWRDAIGYQSKLDAQTGKRVLQPAALWLHQVDGRTKATADELGPVIKPTLKAVRWSHGSPEDFLKAVRDESGLLTGWDQEHYGFMHLGFQEYLAAREIRIRAYQDPAVLRELAAHFGESWWREVILLLLTLEEPSHFDAFMAEVVKLPAFAENPDVVEMCLDDAAEVSVTPFVELIEAPPGNDRKLWERQFAALRLVECRLDESAMESLESGLQNHPDVKIRQWFKERFGVEDQTVVYAKQGGYELVKIPAGSFMMGSTEYESEQPVHEVKLSEFYMGRYPVTNEEYGRFLAGNPEMPEPKYWGDSQYNQARQPVVGVSWNDAVKYAKWAELYLPTEAQWEYACRAGTTTRFYTGNDESDLDRAGWYSENSGRKLHPVGEKEPNAWGLYDMHGNVWEWCRDWYGKDYYSKSPSANPTGPKEGANRVIRGGAWYYTAEGCRSASRYRYVPGNRDSLLGFRLVLLPGQQSQGK